MSALTAEQQAGCLAYHLFQDDFGEPGDRVLQDRIGVARKVGPCVECGGAINPGEQQRRHVGVYGGEMRTYRVCCACCIAMAASWTDDNEALEARWALRAKAPTGTSQENQNG